MTSGPVTMLCDRTELIGRYRSALVAELEASGSTVREAGLFRGSVPQALETLAIALRVHEPLVASNLRSNLLALTLWWIPGLVILNGMGRYRRSKFLRWLVVALLSGNQRKAVAVQSYADFRYLRRHATGRTPIWVPGSGGRRCAHGGNGFLVAVQRDDKLPLVAPSLHRLLVALPGSPRLTIVGCRDAAAARRLLAGHDISSPGYLPRDQLLASGSIFVQPSGYGEGFPHSLADAIVSGMEVYISRGEYIRYGLWRLGAQRTSLSEDWLRVRFDRRLIDSVSERTVTASYLQLLEGSLPVEARSRKPRLSSATPSEPGS